jgi:hypothetical protein
MDDAVYNSTDVVSIWNMEGRTRRRVSIDSKKLELKMPEYSRI